MGYRRLTERQIEKMKQTFLSRPNIAHVARKCKVCQQTVQRYRKKENWDNELTIPPDGPGGKTLTAAIAVRCVRAWRHKIPDAAVAEIVGVKLRQIKSWLEKNTKVTLPVRTVQIINNVEKVTESHEIIGFRDLRTREKARVLDDYLARIETLSKSAADAEDYRAAINAMQWLVEKQYPGRFGKYATEGGGDEGPKKVAYPFTPPVREKKEKST